MADALVDLRSDTVTRPTPEMRRAMADAEVGDDLYGEDPTVRRLQEEYAALVGKDTALYVPSGTMANQVAICVLGRPGTAVVAGRRSHIVAYEDGAAALNARVQLLPLDDHDGTLPLDDVREAVAGLAHHNPEVSAVTVENTHMPANGAPWPVERLGEIGEYGVPVHLDGARLFNASVAVGVPVATLAAPATTVMSCLSKGLAAPVGSVLAGPADVMGEAWRARRRLGGAMRQSGVIAAAGLVALRTMVDRLAEDHTRARRLAEAVADRWPAAGFDPAAVQTNIVTWRHPAPELVVMHLRTEGVLAGTIAPGVLRLVTHHDVDDDGVERARKALASAP